MRILVENNHESQFVKKGQGPLRCTRAPKLPIEMRNKIAYMQNSESWNRMVRATGTKSPPGKGRGRGVMSK
jgi:hypothetical protein